MSLIFKEMFFITLGFVLMKLGYLIKFHDLLYIVFTNAKEKDRLKSKESTFVSFLGLLFIIMGLLTGISVVLLRYYGRIVLYTYASLWLIGGIIVLIKYIQSKK